jgi:hypothetical protein
VNKEVETEMCTHPTAVLLCVPLPIWAP